MLFLHFMGKNGGNAERFSDVTKNTAGKGGNKHFVVI